MVPSKAEKARRKKELILRAAARVFYEKGFPQGTIVDIAKEAGIAYGLPYTYFKSKEDILFQLFRNHWQSFANSAVAISKEHIPADLKLQKIVKFFIAEYERDPILMEVLVLYIVPHSPFSDRNRAAVLQAFRLIAEVIKEGQKDGLFNRSINPQIAAQGIYGSVIQILVGWIKGFIPQKPNYPKATHLVRVLIQGLKKP
jgi:TetR/AcrR family transcriptional regulator, fatty acid metabolism regulator protein